MELHRTVQRTCGIFIEGRDSVVLHALLWLSLGQDLNPNKHKEEIFGSKSKNQEISFKEWCCISSGDLQRHFIGFFSFSLSPVWLMKQRHIIEYRSIFFKKTQLSDGVFCVLVFVWWELNEQWKTCKLGSEKRLSLLHHCLLKAGTLARLISLWMVRAFTSTYLFLW